MEPTWKGDDYQRRFDELAAAGEDVHGEARFVRTYEPHSVLDAGCGTGRVAIEVAQHGIEVVGVDRDASMLQTARDRGPDVTWVEGDLATLDLGRTFDIVLMAGNVPLFASPGTQGAVVARAAAHLVPGGLLMAGFSTDWEGRPYTAAEHDRLCAAAGLVPVERFSTWDRDPWTEASTYAVCVARREE